ncbi:hypothetical protein ACNKHW_02385 [Shigella flexneri]
MLSLICGVFDSGVSSYMLMRRGCACIPASLTSAAQAHEIGVRQVAHYLWNGFGSPHRVRFVAIHFEPVVGKSEQWTTVEIGRYPQTSDGACRV